MWLRETLEAVNDYPWTSLFIAIWLLACLTLPFIEKEK